MKLELKHIAPYLPYELKIKYNNSTEGHWNTMMVGHMTSDIIQLWKPILRPLSDLTKEEFRSEFNKQSEHVGFDFDYFSDFTGFFIAENYVLSFPFDIIQWLIEKHFDVFGLIRQGLAIDINTIQQ